MCVCAYHCAQGAPLVQGYNDNVTMSVYVYVHALF